MNNFERWWYDEGSANRPVDEDIEEFSKRMCEIAWSNGAYMERERAALKVVQMGIEGYGTLAIAAAIRKGDKDAPT